MFAGLTDDQYKAVYEVMGQKGWCRYLQPLPGSQAFIVKLRDLGEVFAVTTPHHSRNWTFERAEWLENLYKIQFNRIVFTEAKYVVSGDVLIDDSSPQIP